MKKFALGMVALTGLAALAGSAEARERRFLFFRYDDGRNYSQPAYYQPAPQQQTQTPPPAPPATEETAQAPAQPAAQAPAAQAVQVPATQPAQPLAVQQPMQQQYNNNYNNNNSGGGFFDRLMEFERRKNAWLFGR